MRKNSLIIGIKTSILSFDHNFLMYTASASFLNYF